MGGGGDIRGGGEEGRRVGMWGREGGRKRRRERRELCKCVLCSLGSRGGWSEKMFVCALTVCAG